MLILDYVYGQQEFENLLQAATDAIPGLEKVVASKLKIRTQNLFQKRQGQKRKREEAINAPRKRTCMRKIGGDSETKEIQKEIHQKLYQRPMMNTDRILKLPMHGLAETKYVSYLHSQHFHVLDKTRGNLCLFYIDPRKVRCLLIDQSTVHEFSLTFVDGLSTLGETLLYGVFSSDIEGEGATFVIYDVAIYSGSNICNLEYSRRREVGSQLFALYQENKGKGNITSKLRLLLKKPCVPISRRDDIKSQWKNKGEKWTFEWGETSLPTEGVILIPEKLPLFPSDFKKREFPPLFLWLFPFLKQVDFHVRIPMSKTPELMAYDSSKRCLVTIQKERIPQKAQNILQLAQEQSLAINQNMSAMIISCRFDMQRGVWMPDKQSKAIRPFNLRSMNMVKSNTINAIKWDTFRGAPKMLNPECHSCNKQSADNHLYLPVHEKYRSVLKKINVNQNKKGTMELIATPKIHKREFWEIDTQQPGYVFWWALMKFTNDQLFNGNCSHNPSGLPLTSKVVLEVSYGTWITHEHAHVHIQMEEFTQAMPKLGYDVTHVNRKPLDHNTQSTDCTEEILPFRSLNFRDWCWNDAVFNNNPIFRWINEWLGKALVGFTFQIELSQDGKGPVECGYFIRVDNRQADRLRQLLGTTPPWVKLRLPQK